MKQALYTAVVSLLSGIAFSLGLVAVAVAYTYWEDEPQTSEGQWVEIPPGLTVLEHRRVEGAPRLTIQGVLANQGSETWQRISLEARVLAGGAQVNECESSVSGRTAPGERRGFQIECYNVTGEGAPPNLTYEVRVRSAVTGN
jgi:hypothetical protein